MPETTLTSSQVILFGLYTLIAIVGGFAAYIFGRGNISNMGEKVRNEAMATINNNFSIILDDARIARTELGEEREKRARLEERVDGLLKSMDDIRSRLSQVEGEKKALEAEKTQLEQTIDLKSIEYQKLMASIKVQVDNAVEKVRKEYESRINLLETQIHQKAEEIAKLKSQLEEKSHEENHTPQNPIPTVPANPVPAPNPTDPSGAGSHTGNDTTN